MHDVDGPLRVARAKQAPAVNSDTLQHYYEDCRVVSRSPGVETARPRMNRRAVFAFGDSVIPPLSPRMSPRTIFLPSSWPANQLKLLVPVEGVEPSTY